MEMNLAIHFTMKRKPAAGNIRRGVGYGRLLPIQFQTDPPAPA
jgi:hypothetical protein